MRSRCLTLSYGLALLVFLKPCANEHSHQIPLWKPSNLYPFSSIRKPPDTSYLVNAKKLVGDCSPGFLSLQPKMLETDHTLADLEARSQTVAARIADLEVEASRDRLFTVIESQESKVKETFATT